LFCVPERLLIREAAGESLEAEIARENAEFASRVEGFYVRNSLDPLRAELGLFILPQRIVAGYVGAAGGFQTIKPLILNTLFALVPVGATASGGEAEGEDDDREDGSY